MSGWKPVVVALWCAAALGFCTRLETAQTKRLVAEAVAPKVLTLTAVGDTVPLRAGEKVGGDNPFEGVKGLIAGSDLFIFNAEGVFSENPSREGCRRFTYQSTFAGTGGILGFVPRGQVSVASQANNHALDCGVGGLLGSKGILRENGIIPLGTGRDPSEACKPLRLKVHGLDVAVVAYLEWVRPGTTAPHVASLSTCEGYEEIALLKHEADVVIVLLHSHLSNSWTKNPGPRLRRLAERLLDGGADIVIGSGPHVPQGVMVRKGKMALLSLGNFLFDQEYDVPEQARESVIARFVVTGDQIRLTVTPIVLDGRGRPGVPAAEKGLRILRDIARRSERLGSAMEITDGLGQVVVERGRSDAVSRQSR